jgi:beta-1,4-mannooligosaccharide/beta-1,4-mannosyl-N-acetylglucosamine phosphorylase
MTRISLPNIPWEERPANSSDVVWRYSGNPIIPRNLIPSSNSIFNSAVVPFKEGFAGVFRCDNKKREMNIHRSFSADGLDWSIEDNPIEWRFKNSEHARFEHRYDPRITWLEDRYYTSRGQELRFFKELKT